MSQTVIIEGAKSDPSHILEWGVPHGPVLGPLLFMAYTARLSDIADRHEIIFHLYADDTQPYLSFRPAVTNRLKLNDDMTAFLLIGRKCGGHTELQC